MRAFPNLTEEQEEILKEEARQKCLEDLHYLAKHILGYDRLTEHYHRSMAKDIDTPKYKFKLLLHPRGHFKSTLGTESYPIKKSLENPNLRCLITNAKLDNSRKFLRTIAKHFNSNPRFRWVWRDWWIKKYATEYDRATMKDKLDWVVRDVQDELTLLRPGQAREATFTTGAVDASMVSQHYCLFAGSKVLTSKGLAPVEQVRAGHRVLTKDGQFKSVVAVGSQVSSGTKVRIKPAYTSEVTELTGNHRVLVYRDDRLQWVEAGKLTENDRLVVPKMKGGSGAPSKVNSRLNRLYRTPDIWRLLGYWVGDGCRTPTGTQIRIVQGLHEKENVEDIVNIVKKHLGCKVSVRETKSSTYMICFSDKDFKELTKCFGDYAYNKRLPAWVLSNFGSKQIEFLKGYFRADGCVCDNIVSFSSTSLDLLIGVQLLLAQFDIPSGIRRDNNSGETQILDYTANVRDSWNLQSTHPLLKLLLGLTPEKFPTKPFRSFFTDKYWVTGIDKLEKEEFENEVVYDIQVAEDGSFYCPGMIVHNSLIVADDLINREYVRTKEMVEKSILYFKDLLDLLDPDGELLVIGTRWSHMDLYAWIIEEFGHKASYSVPVHIIHGQLEEALQRAKGTPEEEKSWLISITPTSPEKPVFPEEFGPEVLQELLEAKGPYEFGAQYLLDPTPAEHQKFLEEWFKPLDLMSDTWLSTLDICITVDPAISLEDSACDSSIVVCGYDEHNRMFFLDGVSERLSEHELPEAVFDMVAKWQKKGRFLLPVGFESVGFQQLYIYTMERMMLERGLFFAIEPIARRNMSKDERILRLVPRIKNEFYIPRKIIKQPYSKQGKPYDLVEKLKWQLLKFPFAGKKDLADALADQLDIVKAHRPPRGLKAAPKIPKTEFVHPSIVEDKKYRKMAAARKAKRYSGVVRC